MNRVEPGINVYVGHRYVPLLVGEWDKSIQYEGLSIVTFQGGSYTSKKMTPPGIDIKNEEFWVLTGNYNAQVEYYRLETERVADDLAQAKIDLNKRIDDTVEYVDTNIENLTIYVNDEVQKTKEYVDDEVEEMAGYVNSELVKNDFRMSQMMINVMEYGAKGDSGDDTSAIQLAFNEAPENSTILFPHTNDFYNFGEITINKSVKVLGGGVINGTFKPLKSFNIQGMFFSGGEFGINLIDMEGSFTIRDTEFNNVDYPIYAIASLNNIKNVDNFTVDNVTIKNASSGVRIRYKRINHLTVINNNVENIETSERYAVAFGLGASSDEGQDNEFYIKNINFDNNIIENINNSGTGSDWEASGLMSFAENIKCTGNTIKTITSNSGNDSEGIYSKGYNISIENNTLIDAGGTEGAICLKRNDNKKSGMVSVNNNKIEFSSKDFGGMNGVGLLLDMEGVKASGNTFKNCSIAIETYGIGTEGLNIDGNTFNDCTTALSNRITNVRKIEDDLIFKNNEINEVETVIRNSLDYSSKYSFIIKNNKVKNMSAFLFNKRGVIKKVIINNNDIITDVDYDGFILQFDREHENGMDIIIKNNMFGESNGRILVFSTGGEHYSPFTEISNNTVISSERGFAVVDDIDLMVFTNNNLINTSSHKISAEPTIYYRLNNPTIEDVTPEV